MKNLDKEKIINSPESQGLITFRNKEKLLYVRKCSNIKKSLQYFQKIISDDKIFFQLISLTETFDWKETGSLWNTLLEEKILIDRENPEFNYRLKPYENYVYLSINFNEPPFFRIAENTQGALYYIGPFRDRFFLHDFIFTMGDLFGFPTCEDQNFPCDKLKLKTCSGYCLKDKNELRKTILNSYLLRNQEQIELIYQKKKKLFDDLSFQKADVLNEQLKILEKYSEIIKFLQTAKKIDTVLAENNKKIVIRNCLIESMETSSGKISFVIQEIDYRENELFAINKDVLDEMWIVYNHLIKTMPKEIDKIHQDSISEIKNLYS